MKGRDPVFIHPNPRPDHDHGSARGPDEIREASAREKEDRIYPWRGFAFDLNEDPARNHKKRAYKGDEAQIFAKAVYDRMAFP